MTISCPEASVHRKVHMGLLSKTTGKCRFAPARVNGMARVHLHLILISLKPPEAAQQSPHTLSWENPEVSARMPVAGLESLTRELTEWLGALIAGVPCVPLGPGTPHPDEGISLRLVSAEPLATFHSSPVAPLTLSARYLVTASSGDIFKAHHIYGEILFAALTDPKVSLTAMDMAGATLRGLGLAPVPCLMFDARLSRLRARAQAPLVRHPLVVHASDMNESQGHAPTSGRDQMTAAHPTAITTRRPEEN
jgi:hypothetical protein